MKILILSDARSIHTKRWVSSLREKGDEVVLFSLIPADDDFFTVSGIRTYYFNLFRYKSRLKGLYMHLRAAFFLRKVLHAERPDILHAHYITSFGLVGALSLWHPFVISLWGSDIYDFPHESLFNRLSVKYVLKKADRILSTSRNMASEAARYTGKDILVTPFGVDTSVFRRIPLPEKDTIVIGNVKALSPKYGIDCLIRAFAILCSMCPGRDMRLVIAGKGPDREKLETLAADLGVASRIDFAGFVRHDRLPELYSSFDIAAFLSYKESFGVSAVEAMSCSCPVVASDTDGFTEVVEDGVTGIIVGRGDPGRAAEALRTLVMDRELRLSMGKKGRERVCRLYEWDDNVRYMRSIYSDLTDGNGK